MTQTNAETLAVVRGAERIARQWHPPLVRRIRFQLGGALVAGASAPALFGAYGLAGEGWTGLTSAAPSFLAVVAAISAGYFLVRRYSPFGGVHPIANLGPCMLVAFLGAGLLLAIAQVPVNLDVLGPGLVLSSAWLLFAYHLRSRLAPLTLAAVPNSGRRLDPAPGIRIHELSPFDDDLSRIDAIVADLRADLPRRWERAITSAVLAGIPVYDIRQVAEILTGRVEVASLSENDFSTSLPSKVYHPVKRIADLAAALALLPVFLPVIALFGLLIRLETPGPMFFVQERMGLMGRPFRIYKLRSMRTDQGEGRHFTVDRDPRVTRVGWFIRKYRIDEFPQIFNIIRGEMSWIGPRPEALPLAEWYAREVPFYMFRHAVRPGITGWAQVCQGNVAEVEQATTKLKYDFYYSKYFSAELDLLIVFRTIRIMLTGFGSR